MNSSTHLCLAVFWFQMTMMGRLFHTVVYFVESKYRAQDPPCRSVTEAEHCLLRPILLLSWVFSVLHSTNYSLVVVALVSSYKCNV
jgi:hypothetical protein